MKEVNELRYIQTRNSSRFLSAVKITVSSFMTFLICVGVIKYFGSAIAKTAFDFTFLSIPDKQFHQNEKEANYENDFLTFLSYEQTEQDKPTPTPAPTPSASVTNNSAIVVNLSALSGKYKNYNGTSLINNTDYDVSSIMNKEYKKPVIDKQKPAVLIYHTHTSEQYYGGGTVVDVGKTMAQEFEALGYKTVHITEVYDKEQFSGAYSRSIKGVQKALEENPDIKLVFDIHRDAITASNGDVYQPLTTVEGKNCAQVMFVCGTDEKGLSHPHWRENFKFALDVSRTMGKNYGSLSRPVNLRGDRFNTHTTNHSFLIEVGSNANTLQEAQNAAIYTARTIIKTIEQ